MTRGPGRRVFNCVESHEQHEDWPLEKAKSLGLTAKKKKIPPAVDLREPWWNVGNQGTTGSCVGWAFADSLLRYRFVKAGKIKKHEHMSVRYIWMAAKEMDHVCTYPTTFIDDAGTSAKAALRVVTKIGALKTSVLPFDGGLVKLKESNFLKVAGRYKVKAYFNLCGTQSGKLERFKEWLAFHGPILTRLKCDSGWNNIGRDGHLRKLQQEDGPWRPRGLHRRLHTDVFHRSKQLGTELGSQGICVCELRVRNGCLPRGVRDSRLACAPSPARWESSSRTIRPGGGSKKRLSSCVPPAWQ